MTNCKAFDHVRVQFCLLKDLNDMNDWLPYRLWLVEGVRGCRCVQCLDVVVCTIVSQVCSARRHHHILLTVARASTRRQSRSSAVMCVCLVSDSCHICTQSRTWPHCRSFILTCLVRSSLASCLVCAPSHQTFIPTLAQSSQNTYTNSTPGWLTDHFRALWGSTLSARVLESQKLKNIGLPAWD